MMGQSRTMSLIESVSNVIVGVLIQTGGNWLIFPWFGFHPDFSQLVSISAIMTAISIARSYTMRRLFNQMYLTGRP